MKQVLLMYREPDRLPPYETAAAAAGLAYSSQLPSSSLTLQDASGLILLGGTDVNPALYGEEPHPETDPPDIERDTAEMALLWEALERDLPVLAICRGHQLMNVCLGGSLIQHIPNPDRHRQRNSDAALPAHEIAIEPGTLLSKIAGTKTWSVNSRHHQAIRVLGQGLRVAAVDPEDGTIEAVDMPDHRFVLGVQWHPEDQLTRFPEQLQLFRAFASAL